MYGITFSVEGKDVSLNVTRPDRSEVTATDEGVSIVEVRDGVIISVDDLTQGVWNVVVGGSGNGTLTASGLSPLRLSAFDFVSVQGRPGHDGYFPVDASSTTRSSQPAIAFIDGNFTTANFELRSALGRLRDVSFKPGTGKPSDPPKNSFFGNVPLPSSDSLIYVTGTDSKGAPYLCVLPSSVIPMGNGTSNGTASSSNSTTSPFPRKISTIASSFPYPSSNSSISTPPYPTFHGSTTHTHTFPTSRTPYPLIGGTAYSTPGGTALPIPGNSSYALHPQSSHSRQLLLSFRDGPLHHFSNHPC